MLCVMCRARSGRVRWSQAESGGSEELSRARLFQSGRGDQMGPDGSCLRYGPRISVYLAVMERMTVGWGALIKKRPLFVLVQSDCCGTREIGLKAVMINFLALFECVMPVLQQTCFRPLNCTHRIVVARSAGCGTR